MYCHGVDEKEQIKQPTTRIACFFFHEMHKTLRGRQGRSQRSKERDRETEMEGGKDRHTHTQRSKTERDRETET